MTVEAEDQENKDSEEATTTNKLVVITKSDVTSSSETKEVSVAPTGGENKTLQEERQEEPMDTAGTSSEEKSKTKEDATASKQVCIVRLNPVTELTVKLSVNSEGLQIDDIYVKRFGSNKYNVHVTNSFL